VTYLALMTVGAVLSLLGMAFIRTSATRSMRTVAAAVVATLLLTAVVARIFEVAVASDLRPSLVLFSAVVAVCGGSLAATAVFDHVDRADMRAAADILRGGIWIGALERLAVFGSLVAGLPEGLAVVLAVKALGRYPELRIDAARSTDKSGVGERFIIGTMVSLLWAAGAAYVALAAG
jgi:hypothetical protein